MAIPPVPDADPDPTTQITWPSRSFRRVVEEEHEAPVRDHSTESSSSRGAEENVKVSLRDEPNHPHLTTWNLITLSIAMGGSQVAWTVELGYGTPFLLSLGLTEQLTSLVWLAGPISGLIAQPVIGAISDSSTSKYRRRYWIATSTVVLVASTLCLAFCQDISAFFVDLFGGGEGDWDPKRIRQVSDVAIALAIVSFYLLDFALNALQASLRNLLLDITPQDQLNAGNAWHGRMTHAGNIIGYGFGFFPLARLPILRWLGGDQFRKFCVVAMAILVVTVWVTCWCHEEKARQRAYKRRRTMSDVLGGIYNATITLPEPIRRVCFVQLFAFMGWFPFLFYSTTYVGQIMAYEHNEEPDKDVATRTGEFAMLIYSIVAVVAGSLLPHLARRDRRLLAFDDEDEDTELARLQDIASQWRAEAARRGKTLRVPAAPLTLRNIWTAALLLFSAITFSTFFISTVTEATVAIGLVGICWAVAIWVPFAIVMEFLKEMEMQAEPIPGHSTETASEAFGRPPYPRTLSVPSTSSISSPSAVVNERQPLLRRRSYDGYHDTAGDAAAEPSPVAGGTVLGIHNLAIVFPQFIIALVSSAIFHVVDADVGDHSNDSNTYLGKNGVAWVLRFGGLCTLIGAVIARMVPPTRTEKLMQRLLGEMRELQREGAA